VNRVYLKKQYKNTRGPFATAILALFALMVPTLAFGELVLLRDDGQISRYTGPPCTTATTCPGWILIDSGIGRPTQIAAQVGSSFGSVLFQRHEDGSIWTWDGQSCYADLSLDRDSHVVHLAESFVDDWQTLKLPCLESTKIVEASF
jgi:hypothetical protein